MLMRALLIGLVLLAMVPAVGFAQGSPWEGLRGTRALENPVGVFRTVSLVREEVRYEHDGVELVGYLVYDENVQGKRPGVMVVHEWWGLNEYAKSRVDMLASMGYVAFACDVYGEPATTDRGVASQRARGFYADRKLFRERLRAGLAQLVAEERTDAQRLAAIGYCFGGTAVLELARDGAPLKAVVCFHGGLSNPTPADDANINCMVLVCNGAADPLVPMEDRQAFIASMEEFGVDYQFIEYGGALHTFTNPAARVDPADPNPASGYQREADERSWRHMKAWLEEAFAAE